MIVLSVGAFYWTPRHVVDSFFQCGGRFFKIHYWYLVKYCPIMSYLVESDTDGTRGTSDDTAIPIDEWVSADEFVIFLDFFYRGSVPFHYV